MHRNSSPTIILGGGLVGLFSALHLSQQPSSSLIVLIERSDHLLEQLK